MSANQPRRGVCDCGEVRYQVNREPIYVHCCHCTWCQRESGSAFALNAMVERSEVELLAGQPALVETPTPSGKGQHIARCPNCQVALWSHYGGMGELLCFIKVGTLDDPNGWPPDIHIFTSTRQTWFPLSTDGIPVSEAYYDRKELWNASQLARFDRLLALKKG